MNIDGENFEIDGYASRSAAKILDQMDQPIDMLRLFAHPQNWKTLNISHDASTWEITPGHRFVYSIGLQPQPAKISRNWGPRFSLELYLEDFFALYEMLMQIKQTHQDFLRGGSASERELTCQASSARLSFSAIYSTSKSTHPLDDAPKGRMLVGSCNIFNVGMITADGSRPIGSYSLYSGMSCMTGLILEAERINALIKGAEQEAVQAIKRLLPGPKHPFDRPTLMLVHDKGN